jgi:transposase
MDYHQNARLTVHSREQMCQKVVLEGVTLKLAASSFNVSAKTAAKWVRRYREDGTAGLSDRSSRPKRIRAPTSDEQAARVEVLRRERWTGQRIAHATHQRQGRTLHPDRTTRMGLRPHLSELRRTRATPRSLDTPVQLASTLC